MTREKTFYEMMESIYDLSRFMYAYESKPRNYGIKDKLYMVEVHTINVIGENNNLNLTKLAELTHKTKGAASQIVDKLLKKGLVVKEKNSEDNREIFLNLTKKGQKVYDYHKKLDSHFYSRYLENLSNYSEEDLKRYIDMTNIITKVSISNEDDVEK